jgi:hypothetical protein
MADLRTKGVLEIMGLEELIPLFESKYKPIYVI